MIQNNKLMKIRNFIKFIKIKIKIKESQNNKRMIIYKSNINKI